MMHGRIFSQGALVAGLCLLGFLLLGPALTIPRHIPLSYNEGWNAYFAMRAVFAGAGSLYPPPGALVFNNYPPISFYLVGALGRFLIGDMIVAGRIVALGALLASALLLGICMARLGGSLRYSIAVAVAMLLFAASFFPDYIAMDDPQWLAQAFMLGGLAILLRNRPAGPIPAGDAIAAVLLMLTGGLVKHNLVGLPLAVTIWLGCVDRPALLSWTAASLLGLAAAAAVAFCIFGPDAFSDILGHERIMRLQRLPKMILGLAPLFPMAAIGLAACNRHRSKQALLVMIFLPIALFTGLAQRVGEGVNYNASFETLIAACLAFGMALSLDWGAHGELGVGRLGRNGIGLICLAPVMLALPQTLPAAWAKATTISAREAAFRPIIAQLAEAPAPAICETLALCYWAGKPFTVDMFNLNQAMLTGTVPLAAMRAAARGEHGFAVVEYQLLSPVHDDAMRQIHRDPIMDVFVGQCAALATGPRGMLVFAPRVAEAWRQATR